jgi:hypothetical protein
MAQHTLNRRPIAPRDAILGVRLKILAQAPAAIDPGNRTFDYPAAWKHLETNLLGRTLYDLNRNTEHLGGLFHCRFAFASLLLTYKPAQLVVNLQHSAIFVPLIEVIANHPRRREVKQNEPPLTVGTILIHQRIQGTPEINLPWPPWSLLRRNNRFNKRPLRVGQIGLVTHRNTWFLAYQYTNQS